MNAPALINAALVSRGMQALDGYCACPCCGDASLTRDDMASTDLFHQSTINAVSEQFGGLCCIGCVDERSHWQSDDGEDARLDAEHIRQERHGWEQV